MKGLQGRRDDSLKILFFHEKHHAFLMFHVVKSLPITVWQFLFCRSHVPPLMHTAPPSTRPALPQQRCQHLPAPLPRPSLPRVRGEGLLPVSASPSSCGNHRHPGSKANTGSQFCSRQCSWTPSATSSDSVTFKKKLTPWTLLTYTYMHTQKHLLA